MGVLILSLSLVGLWISVYFTGIYYKWFPPHVFWMPQVCQLKEESCMTVLGTPRAKLFGVPNSALGIAVYAFLALGGWAQFPWLAIVLVTFAFLRSIYLAYSLLFITRIPCPLCFASHAINLILFLLLLLDLPRHF